MTRIYIEEWDDFEITLLKIVNNLKNKNPEYHHYSDDIACSSVEVFCDVPTIQKCLDLEIDCSLPISYINFKKNQSIMALVIVLNKIRNMYSDSDDYSIFLNGDAITINSFIEIEENWTKIMPLIKDKNTIAIQHIDTANYEYFRHLMVYPIYTDKNKSIQSAMEYLDIWNNITHI